MRWAALAVVLAGAAGLLAPTTRVSAGCTPAPSPDPIAESDVIVAGRIFGWQVATDIERPTPVTPDSYEPVPIRLFMDVDRTYKGAATTEIEFVNGQSLDYQAGRFSWTFATFACGDFREDPTGIYLVVGLGRGEDGTLREAARFFEGESATGAQYDEVTSHLGAGYLPAAGGAPRGGGDPALLTIIGITALSIIAAGVATMAIRHGRRPG